MGVGKSARHRQRTSERRFHRACAPFSHARGHEAGAAEGRTNREVAQALFITTKTVKDHLGSAYGKLQVSSRTELAGALAGGD